MSVRDQTSGQWGQISDKVARWRMWHLVVHPRPIGTVSWRGRPGQLMRLIGLDAAAPFPWRQSFPSTSVRPAFQDLLA